MEATTDIATRDRLYEARWATFRKREGITNFSDRVAGHVLQNTFPVFGDFKPKLLEELTPDIAVVRWAPGIVLFEEGSYLDMAYYVVEGEIEVYVQKHQPKGGSAKKATPTAEMVRDDGGDGAISDETTIYIPEVEQTRTQRRRTTKLTTMDFDLTEGDKVRLGAGEVFGEIGALNGWPQSVTARTATACTVLQIRLPALRKLKRKSKKFRKWIDDTYRARTLMRQLRSSSLFEGSPDAFVEEIGQAVTFVSCDPDEVVAEEGTPCNDLYMVRSGFLKLSQRMGNGEIVVSYLSKGMTFGEMELLNEGMDTWQHTITSVGYTELLRIEAEDLKKILYHHPAIERRLWESAVQLVQDTGKTKQNLERSELIEFSLAKGLVQGNSILMIDLDVCTRCDDCMRGCASTHGGRPRFIREGDRFDNFLIARSCYHCDDPVCLIGCPTGAIQRTNVGEVIAVDDNLCIGCSNCAENCPYDAIVMHDLERTWPQDALPDYLRGEPQFVASKCDLCYTSNSGPACVNSCPHSCAFRVSSIDEFQQLIGGTA